MPCVPVPKPTVPSFPVPFTVPSLPVPPVVDEPELCCQLPDFLAMIASHIPPPPLPPGTINPATAAAIAAAIQAAVDAIDGALDAITPDCPRQE